MLLNDLMEFDHVIRVLASGSVLDADNVFAPTLCDDELDNDAWALLDGYSGQHGYSGPMMHASEFVSGGLDRDILARPGYYVTLVNYQSDDSEPESWGVAYREESGATYVR